MSTYYIALRHFKWTWVHERDIARNDTILNGLSLFELPPDFIVSLMALIMENEEVV